MTPASEPKQTSLGTSGGVWEAFEGYVGGIWEASGRSSGRPGRRQEAQRRLGGKSCQNICVLPSKVKRPTISPARDESNLHQLL